MGCPHFSVANQKLLKEMPVRTCLPEPQGDPDFLTEALTNTAALMCITSHISDHAGSPHPLPTPELFLARPCPQVSNEINSFFFFCFLRQSLTMYPRLTSKS
jgi:hypothetical protein